MTQILHEKELRFARAALRRGVMEPEAMTRLIEQVKQMRGKGSRMTLPDAVRKTGVATFEVKAILRALDKPEKHPSVKGYHILGELGRGSLGAVYKARQVSMNRLVALKVLPKVLVDQDRDLDRFLREARLAASLNHSRIVRIYEVGEDRDRYFISMEFLPGSSLAQTVAREGVFTVDRALAMAGQIAVGLEHAHARGVIHRDLKPGNVMLVDDGSVRIVDLGLARGMASLPSERITDIGVLVGTPEYMSPEQARDPSGVDGRADVWSLGATLFYALTGRPPIDGKNTLDVLSNLMQGLVTPLSSVRPALPPALFSWTDRALCPDREHRFPDAASARQGLDRILARLSPAKPKRKKPDTRVSDRLEAPPPDHALPERWPWLAFAAVTAGALIGGSLAGILLWPATDGPSEDPPRNAPAHGEPGSIAVQLERRANQLFARAEQHLRNHPDDRRGAIARFQEVTDKYPGTLAAFKARDRIDRLSAD